MKYTVSKANVDSSKNMLLLKNSQFLPNHSETLLKYSSHEYPILAKFRNDWVKIVDFLIKAYFCLSLNWPHSQCTLLENYYFLLTRSENIYFMFQISINCVSI